MEEELAGRSHSEDSGQRLNDQMEFGDKWCPSTMEGSGKTIATEGFLEKKKKKKCHPE